MRPCRFYVTKITWKHLLAAKALCSKYPNKKHPISRLSWLLHLAHWLWCFIAKASSDKNKTVPIEEEWHTTLKALLAHWYLRQQSGAQREDATPFAACWLFHSRCSTGCFVWIRSIQNWGLSNCSQNDTPISHVLTRNSLCSKRILLSFIFFELSGRYLHPGSDTAQPEVNWALKLRATVLTLPGYHGTVDIDNTQQKKTPWSAKYISHSWSKSNKNTVVDNSNSNDVKVCLQSTRKMTPKSKLNFDVSGWQPNLYLQNIIAKSASFGIFKLPPQLVQNNCPAGMARWSVQISKALFKRSAVHLFVFCCSPEERYHTSQSQTKSWCTWESQKEHNLTLISDAQFSETIVFSLSAKLICLSNLFLDNAPARTTFRVWYPRFWFLPFTLCCVTVAMTCFLTNACALLQVHAM